MKPYIPYSILAAALACGMAQAVTSYTTPVGYVSLGNLDPGVASGSNAPAGSDTYIGIPVDRASEFSSVVDGVSGQMVSFAGTPLAGMDLTTVPYMLKIESGTLSGFYALIASKNDSSVTVEASIDLTGLLATDQVTIRKAWTLSALFSTATLPATGIQVFAFDGTEAGTNIQPNLSWAWDGTDWNNNLTLDIDNNAPLYPGEALIFRNESVTNVPSLVATGEVLTANARQTFVGAVAKTDNPFSFQASVGEPILTSGVSSIAVSGDSILVIPNNLVLLNKAAAKTYDYDGIGWADSETLDYIDATTKFEAGVAYIYRREAGGSTATISNQPDYVPSL